MADSPTVSINLETGRIRFNAFFVRKHIPGRKFVSVALDTTEQKILFIFSMKETVNSYKLVQTSNTDSGLNTTVTNLSKILKENKFVLPFNKYERRPEEIEFNRYAIKF